MTHRAGKAVRGRAREAGFAWGCAVLAMTAAALGGMGVGGQPIGPGLTIKDLQRVEQLRGDSGGLSKSLARGPANLAVPNDFSGVYQVPEDADSPYAGWYARVSGGLIAVFPRSEYTQGPSGMVATVSANTRYFLGSIPRNQRPTERPSGVRPLNGLTTERVDRRGADNSRSEEQAKPKTPAPDAPGPVTVDSASNTADVSAAIGKLCGDPIYRANRLRDLLARAEAAKNIKE